MHSVHSRHAHAEELLECLKELLRVERQWLPEREGYSLYIRPFMFSSSHSIGISRPTRSTIAVMLSPVGPYFQTGKAASPDAVCVGPQLIVRRYF